MDDELLARMDHYLDAQFGREDDVLKETRAEMAREKLPSIAVSAAEGRALQVLTALSGATRVLELGTLGGYSATCIARGLPLGGKIISLELDEHHAATARKNIARAGFSDTVDVRVGPALEGLAAIKAAGEPLFDMAFIDADKDNYPLYLEEVYPLVKKGGVILADNTMPRNMHAPNDGGIGKFNVAATNHPGLLCANFPMLRDDSIDALVVCIKVGD